MRAGRVEAVAGEPGGGFSCSVGNEVLNARTVVFATDAEDVAPPIRDLDHGFVPGRPIQALRDLTGTRKQLTREKAAHAQRIDKLLQATNLRLGTVLTDILGASGRAAT